MPGSRRGPALLVGLGLLAIASCGPSPAGQASSGPPVATSASPPLAVTSRFLDAAGDGAPDIIAVSTSVTAGDLILGLEFADDFVLAENQVFMSIDSPDHGPPQFPPVCGTWGSGGHDILMPAVSFAPGAPTYDVGLRAMTDFGQTSFIPLEYTASGRQVSITVPMNRIGDPQVLSFGIAADDLFGPDEQQPDRYPDGLVDGDCHVVALAGSLAGFGSTVNWIADPEGDAAPDIGTVTTWVTPHGELKVQLALAGESWPPLPSPVAIWFETHRTEARDNGIWCSAYGPFGILDWPDGLHLTAVEGDLGIVPYELEGPLLTITLPLARLGDPSELFLHVGLPDDVPNDEEQCLQVPLWEPASQ